MQEHPAALTPAEPGHPRCQLSARDTYRFTYPHETPSKQRKRENSALITDFNNINTRSQALTLLQRTARSGCWETRGVQARLSQPRGRRQRRARMHR